jgi:hypothetical protein
MSSKLAHSLYRGNFSALSPIASVIRSTGLRSTHPTRSFTQNQLARMARVTYTLSLAGPLSTWKQS